MTTVISQSPNNFLYEMLSPEEVNKSPKSVTQIMDFEYGICFSESLVDDGLLTIDEAHDLAVVDQDLRFSSTDMKPISEYPIIDIDVEDEPDD